MNFTFSLVALVTFIKLFGCSTIGEPLQVSVTGKLFGYEGRFSKIELVPGLEPIEALESMVKYNNSISGTAQLCNLICKLKASSIPVIVPAQVADEMKIPWFDHYWLKMKLLKHLSELPVEVFLEDQETFDATIKMVEYHLFYRVQEYTRFLEDVMKTSSAEVEHYISERAWSLILKPVHVIFGKMIRGLRIGGHEVNDLNLDSFSLKSQQSQMQEHMKEQVKILLNEMVQLISSPIEEESQMVASLLNFVLFPADDGSFSFNILEAIESTIKSATSGNLPIIMIDPILKFVGDSMLFCSQSPVSMGTMKLLSILRSVILPLHGHEKFFWIQEAYTHAILQYFIFFEVFDGMTIKRSPFEPVFPIESPFNESRPVSLIRRALIRRSSRDGEHLNQLARFDTMFKLSLYQFYPRAMLVDILESLKSDFIASMSVESALHVYALIIKNEIFQVEDEVSSLIRNSLFDMIGHLEKCLKSGLDSRGICREILNQVELISEYAKIQKLV